MAVQREPLVVNAGAVQQLQSGDVLDIGYPVTGYKNRLINGAMNFWQRGTSFTAGNVYTADRWKVVTDGTLGTQTVSQTAFGNAADQLVREFAPFFLTFAQTVAGSSQTKNQILQSIESVQTFAGQIVTLSFWAQSTGTPTITASLVQNFGTGGSPSASVTLTSGNFVLTGGWVRYTATFTLAAVSGKTLGTASDCLQVIFNLPVNATSNVQLAFIQLERGSVATDFNYVNISDENVRVDRYYQKTYNKAVTPGTVTSVGEITFRLSAQSSATRISRVTWSLPIEMRVSPTVVIFSPATLNASGKIRINSVDLTATTILANQTAVAVEGTTLAASTDNLVELQATADAEF